MKNLKHYQKGMLVGLLVYLPIFLIAFLYSIGGQIEGGENIIGAGMFLLMFGLPTTLIEALLENLNPSIHTQLINLFVLSFFNYLLLGCIGGLLFEKYLKKKDR